MTRLIKIGAVLASMHLIGVLATAWVVYHASTVWAGIDWGFWAVVDFPLSLLYLPAMFGYFDWVTSLDAAHPVAAQLLYLPHLLHGLFGTIWWLYIPTIITKIRSGNRDV